MLFAATLVKVLYDAAHRMPTYVSLAAVVGCLFLGALYLSQRRDLIRIQAWMESAPNHPAEDLVRSEALLDRAEAELEEILGVEASAESTAAQTAVGPPTAEATAGGASQTTTSERPALEQITTEREALLPHPRWRRFTARAGQPSVLAAIAAGAVILGVLGIFASDRLLNDNGGSQQTRKPGALVPHDVSVAVLNGTAVAGLGAKVADDVTANNFSLGTVGNSRKEYDQTVVMYEPGQKKAAVKVAHDLGVKPVQQIDRATQQEAGNADVVVIAGRDRTS
jgi:LytR cell envelope-related transcriptional attenuator